MIKNLLLKPFSPFLFMLFFTLNLYASNYNFFFLSEVIRPILVLFACIAITIFVLNKLLSNLRHASLATLCILIFLTLPYVISCFIIITLAAIYILSQKDQEITVFINIFTIILCLSVSIRINLIEQPASDKALKPVKSPLYQYTTKPHLEVKQKPSIIHIVLDGYSSFENLQQQMNFNNTPFKKTLKQLGFNVYDAKAPHNRTLFSMAAIFYGDYIDKNDFLKYSSHHQKDQRLADIVTKGIVTDVFKQLGYHHYFSNSGYIFKYPKGTELKNKTPRSNIFEFYLSYSLSFFIGKALYPDYIFYNAFVTDSFSIDFVENKLETPLFMYLHILSPHPPFTLDEDGHYTDENEVLYGITTDGDERHQGDKILTRKYRNGYIAKLKYTNKSVLKLIAKIKRQIPGPKIILLHGDHGSKMQFYRNSYKKTCLKESFSTFLAVYSDVNNIKQKFNQQTPFNLVNLYRNVFSTLFSPKLPPLESKYFFVPENNTNNITQVSESSFEDNCSP